ncbi:imidazole glycerol phosphate synthase subunit HisH [Luminiphilus sp.]|nr:imidazole glycerol phosphate synthase subunit HisH [Luminiphilus sp.]
MTTVIVDLDLGNIGSVVNMLEHIGEAARIASDPGDLLHADNIILPGVGAFDVCIAQIDKMGWRDALGHFVCEKKTPLLGVCLGMQVLCNGSEEGKLSGLGFIDGFCHKFDRSKRSSVRIPHMGWNEVLPKPESPLFSGLEKANKFYFTHSYHMVLHETESQEGSCDYGGDFVCAVSKKNIYGVQFHPEKSHRFGKVLLKNFVGIHA